ncbi:DUF481 domain-containing protein [Hydrogenimonas sp.]
MFSRLLFLTLLSLSLHLFASEGEHGKERLSDDGNQTLGVGEKLDDVTREDVVEARQKRLRIEAEESRQKEELRLDGAKREKVDTIVVKGTVLQGRITELTSKYVEYSLVYGTGTIRIAYKDIEQITTEHEYHIFYLGKETVGRVVGIENHTFLIIKHGDVKELVKIGNIDRFILSVKENDTIENRLRNMFPYTRGSIDLGMEFETGIKRKKKISLAYNMVRKVTNHRQILDIHYNYETTETEGADKSLDKKELYISGEENYLLDRKRFYFAQLGYDFDQPRGIEYRLYPSIGYGHRFYFGKETWIQLKGGAGYVYESFYPYDPLPGEKYVGNNDYSALFVGISAKDHLRDLWLIEELILTANVFYMPSLMAPSDDWLSRMTFTVDFPLTSLLSLKLLYRVVNDDNPVPEVGNNKTTTDLLFSIHY